MLERSVTRNDGLGEIAAPADLVHIPVDQVADPEVGAVLKFEDDGAEYQIDGPADRLDSALHVCPVVPCQ